MIWHLVTAWISGHWLFALPIALAVVVLCTPVGLPILRWLFGTRLGLVTLAVFVLLAAWNLADSRGYARGVADTQGHAKTQTDAANLRASESARDAEAARQGVFHSKEVSYAQGQADARAAVAGVLDDVSAGRYVLRASLRCPAVRAGPALAGQAGGPVDTAPAAGILSPDDVRAYLRLAAYADEVLERARLAESLLDAERAPMSLELVPLPIEDSATVDPARWAQPLTPRIPEPPVEASFAWRLVDRDPPPLIDTGG